jgi:NAD+ kinase
MPRQPRPERVALAANPKVNVSIDIMNEMAEVLAAAGLSVTSGVLGEEAILRAVDDGVDLLVTLGGDGSVLRAGHLCAPRGVPILGINLGRIGFLTEVDRGQWRPALDNLLSGDYWLEPHMTLHASLWRGGQRLDSWDVILNECVIGRGGMVRLVRLKAEIEGRYATHFAADALIVATPTGSTAYALAAGGPILPPDLRNILIVPVAPHLSVDRAIVLHEGSWVRVTVDSDHGATLSADGQTPVEILSGDWIEARAGEYNATLVRFQDPGYFYRNLTARLIQNSSPGANV